MTEYSERSTAERMHTAGDIASGQFLAWCARHGYKAVPFGTEHAVSRNRYAPDFKLERFGLVEVMSCGQGVLRLKLEKWHGLIAWSCDWTVGLWIYDPQTRMGGLVGLDTFSVRVLEDRFKRGEFADEHQKRPWYGFDVYDLGIHWEYTDTFIESDYRHGP